MHHTIHMQRQTHGFLTDLKEKFVGLLEMKKSWACATHHEELDLAFPRFCQKDRMQTGRYSSLRDKTKRLRLTEICLNAFDENGTRNK